MRTSCSHTQMLGTIKEKMDDRIKKLETRFEEAKITFKVIAPRLPILYNKIVFEIPAGREKHECVLHETNENLDNALNCQFEKFKFIKNYEAIWSSELKVIEAEISSADLPGKYLFERLYALIIKPEETEDEIPDEIPEIEMLSIRDLKITVGLCSNEFVFLTGCRERGPRYSNPNKITIKIQNIKSTTHDNSCELLEKIANSIFFQIDLAFELPIYIQNQRENWIERRQRHRRKKMIIDSSATITVPKYEYDNEPISLYWYAKESQNMPIFQYLAFYQSIEYYFPIYSSLDAKQKIQNLIKDPRFNPNKDSDISRIISTIKISGGGKTFGNEREQLRATINSCTDSIELRNFLQLDEKRFEFYAKNNGKDIAKQKISIESDVADLISEVSERIYEIRCRIVHSKQSEGNFEVLLPYSAEVKKINYDIELIEFITRKVLISSSRPINL